MEAVKVLKVRSACHPDNAKFYCNEERIFTRETQIWETGLECICGFKAISWGQLENHFFSVPWDDILMKIESEFNSKLKVINR